jgi:hypothetical protein
MRFGAILRKPLNGDSGQDADDGDDDEEFEQGETFLIP